MNIFNTTIPSESLIEYIPTCLLATIPMNIQFAYLDFLKVIQCYHNLTPDLIGRVVWCIARLSTNRKVVGSSPTREGFLVSYKFNRT